MSTCLPQLVNRSKFKKAGHKGKRGVLGSSSSEYSLLNCKKKCLVIKKNCKSIFINNFSINWIPILVINYFLKNINPFFNRNIKLVS